MPTILIVIGAIVIALDIFIALMPSLLRRRDVLLIWRTKFGPALVFDSEADGEEVRLLNVRGTFQSIAYTDPARRDEPVCLYHKYFGQALEPVPLRRALVLGGGGYSFPRWLLSARPGCAVDAVEIDPKITGLARDWFWLADVEREHGGLGEARSEGAPDGSSSWKEAVTADGMFREVEGDGWGYLLGADDGRARWDLIVNDAFSGNHPLGPMETHEGARHVREHLTEDGVYCANVISALEGKKAAPLREVEDAFGREFAWLYLFPERPEEPDKRGNNAFVASNVDLKIRPEFTVKAPGKAE